MTGRRAIGLALFFLVLLGLGVVWWWTRSPGPTLYVGGPILTMEASSRVVEALVTDGERIVAVGRAAELWPWARRAGARVIELRGRALLPGFIDAHSHFPGVGLSVVVADLNSLPIGTIENMRDLVARLAERAATTSAGEWVVGMGYDDTLLAEKRHPTRADLDRVSTRHPVAILHISAHLGVVNSLGLERLGIDATTPDPKGGRIRHDPVTGEPDGVLEENAMMALRPLLQAGFLDGLRVMRRASQLYLAAGVTTAQSGLTHRSLIQGLILTSRFGLVPLRLVLWPDAETEDALLDGSFVPRSHDPRWVRIGAVKLIADGSIQGYTGYLSRPYHVPPGDDPDYRGYPRIAHDALIEKVVRYHAQGVQVAVHANGDAAIDDVLDAFEAAQRAHPRTDARPIVVHAQMARRDQLDRMKTLGAIPSFFTLHTYYWGDRHRDIFMGPERAARMSPARSALDRGLRATIHTDAPVVPMEPLRLVWSAVNRLSTSGATIGVGLPRSRRHFQYAMRPGLSCPLRPWLRFPSPTAYLDAGACSEPAARAPAYARRVGDGSPALRMTGFLRGEAGTSRVTGPSSSYAP